MSRQRVEKGGFAQALGPSRGGFTSKFHARFDKQAFSIGFILTGGEASVHTAADKLMASPLSRPKTLLADEGYDGDSSGKIC